MIISARRLRLALHILCAVTLLVFGFAHRPAATQTSAVLTLYTLPDGTVPSLCVTGGFDHDHPDFGNGCEACRLAASILLPTPHDAVSPPLLREVALLGPVITPPETGRPFQPHAAPRAPPASVFI